MTIIRGPWPERPDEEPKTDDTSEEIGRPGPPTPVERSFKPARNRSYRQRNDPAHVLRFDQLPPKWLPAKLVEFVEVAGIAQPDARRAAEAFAMGEGQYIELERDPENSFDAHAIKVFGVWSEAGSKEAHREQIGWVPRPLAAMIAASAAEAPLAATIRTLFLPRPDAGPGVRLDIWQPRGGRRLHWPP